MQIFDTLVTRVGLGLNFKTPLNWLTQKTPGICEVTVTDFVL